VILIPRRSLNSQKISIVENDKLYGMKVIEGEEEHAEIS
jgi:hypothetical protein